MDIPYCCSAYVYGLAHAKSLIVSGMAKNVLLLTSDVSLKTISARDLELRSIFSDAASATLITEKSAADIGSFVFGTDSSGCKNLYVSRSAFKDPIDATFIEEEKLRHGKMVMNGMEIFNFALREVPALVNNILEKNNMALDDVDLFVFHQPSRFLLETLRKKINIPPEKFFINIEDYGNTVSTTIPLALTDAVKAGKLKKGMKIMVAGFGIGYSWAGTIIKI
jgi:3-oxoacyl-[acyl-carrier-protein] synthase-3